MGEFPFQSADLKRGRCGSPASRRLAGLTAVSVLALGWSTPAAAQASTRRFDVSLTAGAQYDTNVARASSTVATATGVKPGDYRYSATLSVDGARPIGQQIVFVRGTIGYDIYQGNKSLNRERINLTGGTSGRLGPCVVGGRVGYIRTLTETEDLTALDSRNSVQTRATVGVNESCPLFGNIGQSLVVERSEITNEGARTLVNSTTTNISGSLEYHSDNAGAFSLVASQSVIDYSQGPLATNVVANGGKVESLGLRYSRALSSRLSGSASISRYRTEQRGGTVLNSQLTGASATGTGWDVNFHYTANPRLSGDLGWTNTVGATSRVASAFQKDRAVRMGVHYELSSKINTNFGFSRNIRSYAGSAGRGLGVASEEKRTAIDGSVNFKVGRKLSLALTAAHTEVHTDLSILDYKSNRVGILATVRF